jgi:hypothetical protein
VSISITNTLTQIAQAIFRLRNINMGHSIDFYSDEKFYREKKISVSNLLKQIIINEKTYKEKTLQNFQLQFIKYLNRYLHKNSYGYFYREQIYYDLLEYGDEFITQQDFNEYIIGIINETVESYVTLKIIDYNISIDKTAINIQLNKEINININIEINTKNSYNYNFHEKYDFEYEIITFDILDTSPPSLTLLNELIIEDWKISFSLITKYCYNKKINDMNIYFLYNYKNPKKITIINYIDYFTILINHEFFKQNNDYIIFDNYGKIILYSKNTSVLIPSYIKILLFNAVFTLEEIFYNIQILKKYIDDKKYNYLKNFLKIKNNYTIIFTNSENYNDITIWSNIFNLPKLTEQQENYFRKIIINNYINKYVKDDEKYKLKYIKYKSKYLTITK